MFVFSFIDAKCGRKNEQYKPSGLFYFGAYSLDFVSGTVVFVHVSELSVQEFFNASTSPSSRACVGFCVLLLAFFVLCIDFVIVDVFCH